MATVFRPYSASDSLRSDRSAGDRARHREKVRATIRDNIADIIAEEAIIGGSPDRIVKVPIRGIKEYRFVYGPNTPRVGQGGGGEGGGQPQPGEPVGGEGDGDPAQAGSRPGIDYYETDVTLEELVDIMFEDLELPAMERRTLRQTETADGMRRLGFRKMGVRTHLHKQRTARQRVRRRVAVGGQDGDAGAAPAVAAFGAAEGSVFPFQRDDLRYRRRVPRPQRESNAVVICVMDTSGSMDATRKYLARSFFFLLYQFVRRRYQTVDLVFVAHDAEAREVTEQEFFSKGESGGTLVSSGYRKALEIIRDRYDPAHWNVYAFHCSDGDNYTTDNPVAIQAARELCGLCNLFGYGEIRPGQAYLDTTLAREYQAITEDNFKSVVIAGKSEVWPRLQELLGRERRAEARS